MADVDLEVFDSTPSLPAIFAKAVIGGSKKGGALPSTRLQVQEAKVEREKLLAYQRLCRFAVSDVLPHTMPHIMGFPLQAELMSRKSFPLPLMGMVHVENAITVHRELTVDDALDITVSADALRPHPRGQLVDLVTEVDVAGERVWEGRSTYLARGRSNDDAPKGEQPPAMPTGLPAAVWHLPGDLGRQYAAVSGDVNPIHMSAVTAKALGFPKAIAHGMWTYARCLGTLGPAVNGPGTSHVWFKKPVLLPGAVELVADKSGEPWVVGLRKPRKPETEHLVMTWAAAR